MWQAVVGEQLPAIARIVAAENPCPSPTVVQVTAVPGGGEGSSSRSARAFPGRRSIFSGAYQNTLRAGRMLRDRHGVAVAHHGVETCPEASPVVGTIETLTGGGEHA